MHDAADGAGAGQPDEANPTRVLPKKALRQLLAQEAPGERLEPEVEEVLLDIADDFVDSVTAFACSLARHRKSDVLEAKDITLHLRRNLGMSVPDDLDGDVHPVRRRHESETHLQRLAAVRRSFATAAAADAVHAATQALPPAGPR